MTQKHPPVKLSYDKSAGMWVSPIDVKNVPFDITVHSKVEDHVGWYVKIDSDGLIYFRNENSPVWIEHGRIYNNRYELFQMGFESSFVSHTLIELNSKEAKND